MRLKQVSGRRTDRPMRQFMDEAAILTVNERGQLVVTLREKGRPDTVFHRTHAFFSRFVKKYSIRSADNVEYLRTRRPQK